VRQWLPPRAPPRPGPIAGGLTCCRPPCGPRRGPSPGRVCDGIATARGRPVRGGPAAFCAWARPAMRIACRRIRGRNRRPAGRRRAPAAAPGPTAAWPPALWRSGEGLRSRGCESGWSRLQKVGAGRGASVKSGPAGLRAPSSRARAPRPRRPRGRVPGGRGPRAWGAAGGGEGAAPPGGGGRATGGGGGGGVRILAPPIARRSSSPIAQPFHPRRPWHWRRSSAYYSGSSFSGLLVDVTVLGA
jgi:hypothetical protein